MFDSSRRKPDYLLLTLIGVIAPIGLVMVYSASFMDALVNHDGNQLYYFWKQLVGLLIGGMALLVAQRIDYRFLRNHSVHILGFALLLLVLVLILPSSITTVNGARSWIRLGMFSIQPSEVAKLAMLVYFADWLSRRGEKVGNVTYGLVPFGVMLGVIAGLVIMQGDLGSTIVLVVIASTVYFAAGANLLHIAGAAVLAGSAFGLMVLTAGYRQDRISVWLNGPFQDVQGSGWHVAHALYALGSGGLFGAGLGQGRQKFLWLPQAHTDTIFAVIGEEFGIIGTVLVVLAFLAIAYRGYRIAIRVTDPFAALLAIGLTSWIVFQALINIAVVTTLLPLTGITLPFFSYGSTSLVMSMVAVGILLSISRHMVEQHADDVIPSLRNVSFDRAALTDALAVRWRDGWTRVSGAGRGQSAGSGRWNGGVRTRQYRTGSSRVRSSRGRFR